MCHRYKCHVEGLQASCTCDRDTQAFEHFRISPGDNMTNVCHNISKLAACTALLLVPGFACAQSSGGLVEGSVADPQRALVSQASVSLVDRLGTVVQMTTTDASGHFAFRSVSPGTYSVRFSHDGFQSAENPAIAVSGLQPTHLDLVLKAGSVTSSMTVEANDDVLLVPTTTGTRLGLDPLHTPADISIIGNDTLVRHGDDQIEAAVDATPGVSSGGSPADPSQFVVRGFVGNDISLLRDGIYIGPANMVTRSENSFNLESVQLLQGPGSVLYGQGAVGGTINVVTKSPVFAPPAFDLYSSFGSFHTYEVGVGGGGQVSKRLAFRADYSYWASDGYVVNSDPHNLNATGSLLYKIRDNLSARLSLDVLKDSLTSYYGTPYVPASFAASPLQGVLHSNVLFADGTAQVLDSRMRYNNYNVSNPELNSSTYQPSLTLNWQPTPNVQVTEQAYYYHASRNWENAETYQFLQAGSGQTDASGNPIPGNEVARDRFHVFHNQNLPGNSFGGVWTRKVFGKENKVSGGYDFYNISFLRSRGFPNGGSPYGYVDYVDPLHPVQGLYGDYAGDFPSLLSPTKVQDNAGYFEDAIDLSRKFLLVTGIRFENFYLDRLNYNKAGVIQPSQDFSGNYHPFNYRIGGVYSFASGLSAYGQFTTAADAPGNNIFLVNQTYDANGNKVPFKLSTAIEGEGGLKAVFPHGWGEGTLSAYHISKKNILVAAELTDISTDNGTETSTGFEASTIVHPVPYLDVNFNTNYVAAQYGIFTDPNTGLIDNGKIPADVPATTTNLWVDAHRLYRLPLELGAGLRFVGGRYADNANQTQLYNYTTLDSYASYRVKERYTLTARGKNLTNKAYAQWADINYPSEVVIGAPRSFTVSFSGRF
jgi:iron complex outermembrane receptor protein